MSRVRIGHNSQQGFIEDSSLSPSARGYAFQDRWTLAIMRALKGFASVTLKDASGNVMTEANYRRRGPDGGLDLLIEIDAASEAAARSINTRVRNIIMALEFDDDG